MHTTKPNMVNYTTVIYTITVPARMLKLACNCPFNTVGVATYFHGHGTTNMVLEMNCHIFRIGHLFEKIIERYAIDNVSSSCQLLRYSRINYHKASKLLFKEKIY